MSDPVTVIRNIGPAMAREFTAAGITTADEIRDLGADDAYARLIASGVRPHFIGYYALVMGLQGRPWSDCQGAEKAALRTRFDALKDQARTSDTASGLPAEMAQSLDRLGIRI